MKQIKNNRIRSWPWKNCYSFALFLPILCSSIWYIVTRCGFVRFSEYRSWSGLVVHKVANLFLTQPCSTVLRRYRNFLLELLWMKIRSEIGRNKCTTTFNLIGRNYRCKVSGPTFFDRETLATNSFSHDITREKSLKNLKKWSHLINPEFWVLFASLISVYFDSISENSSNGSVIFV